MHHGNFSVGNHGNDITGRWSIYATMATCSGGWGSVAGITATRQCDVMEGYTRARRHAITAQKQNSIGEGEIKEKKGGGVGKKPITIIIKEQN